jgi:hypothetical protein
MVFIKPVGSGLSGLGLMNANPVHKKTVTAQVKTQEYQTV